MKRDEFEEIFNKSAKNWLVYQVLKDHQWHCRECEYAHVKSGQIAGGGGIQGLQRGTQKRPGMKIESGYHFCSKCEKSTRHDRWEGAFESAIQGASMPDKFVKRVIQVLGSRDIVDNTERPIGQLTIDHKLPMIRWSSKTSSEQTEYKGFSDEDIRQNFQLLKKSNGSVSHNLLKSRACENCYKTGKRGTPFGIRFFYVGTHKWEPQDHKDPSGCIGCGWYDFDKWRVELNKKLGN